MATAPVPQDQRKRTLEEALERRFAVAKAERFQQQKKNDKTFVEEVGKETPRRNSSFLNTPIATSSNTSSKKVVPKKLSIFIFQVDCWKITLQASEGLYAFSGGDEEHGVMMLKNVKFMKDVMRQL
ncbi:hypothetical protein V6N12_073893 [Hibiscus sabdariffa]|uniref:Uncharacterized protein n=1 Tax=Hibiscus sabdariffa TaxID=183260 RepID=A0ABR2AVS1_9ROSI